MLIVTIFTLLAGLGLLVWGLAGKSPRGVPRCRRCWYDMSGRDTLVCPECGRVGRSEREFLRSRPRWRVVIASVVVVALSGVAGWVARVGVDAALPDAVHVALYADRIESEQELVRRMWSGQLSAGAWRRLARRNAHLMDTESDTRSILRRLELVKKMHHAAKRPYATTGKLVDNPCTVDLSDTAPVLEGLLAHPNGRIVDRSWVLLRDLFPSRARCHAVEMALRELQTGFGDPLLALFDVEELGERPIRLSIRTEQRRDPALVAFMTKVASCPSVAAALPTFVAGLDDESELVRRAALLLASASGALETDGARAIVLDLLHDPDLMVRDAARRCAFEFPMDDRLTGAVADALSSDDFRARHWAADLVAVRGPAALRERAQLPTLLPACVEKELVESRSMRGRGRVHPALGSLTASGHADIQLLIGLGVPHNEIGDRILAGLDEACPEDGWLIPGVATRWGEYRVERAMMLLSALDDRRAMPLAEANLLAPSPRVRRAAGCTLLHFDGDLDRATGLIIDGSIASGQSELPKMVIADLRRRGLALRMVTPLLADPRSDSRLLAMRMLAAAGPDHARGAEGRLRDLLQHPDREVRAAAMQTLNGFVLND